MVLLWMSQVLLSLPSITPHDLAAFEEALTKTASPKEQKQHMKSLLISATGNKLRSLAAQKSVNVITNVSSKHSNLYSFVLFLLPLPIIAVCHTFLVLDCGIKIYSQLVAYIYDLF